jgi:phosphatidylglycerol lysyltransferase
VTERDRARLQECLTDWLERRGLPPLHFLVEPDTLGQLSDRRLFVAMRRDVVVGFLVASPVPARRGWLIEQIIRGSGAPNGTAELLVDAAMRALAESGAQYVTLGLSPLSRHSAFDDARMPGWLRVALRWVRAHARRFYDFEGLDRFKSKFDPESWEDIVALADAPRFPPRALWAIASAFSQGSPISLIARALGRAARQELRWLRARGARALHRTPTKA